MDQPSQTPVPAKPKLKLKVSSSSGIPTISSATTPASNNGNFATPTVNDSPVTASKSKIKFKVGTKSQPATPATEISQPTYPSNKPAAPTSAPKIPVKTKAGRVTKPSAKKRAKDDALSDDEVALPQSVKRIKLNPKTPTSPAVKVKVKNKGHVPVRPNGDGYDSELEDREVDPVVEEQCILRYEGGVEEDLEYLSQMIEQGRIGPPTAANLNNKDKSAAQFGLKWLPGTDNRRAVVRIRSNIYAAVLLDLPTITESMKSFNKKDFMKSADICQMLLIYKKVKDEAEAKTAPLPAITRDKEHKWPHGLTPPLHDVYNRRFRKRLSKKEIEDKEAELRRLQAADEAAVSTRYEIVTIGEDGRPESPEHDDEQDAEGEEDDVDPMLDQGGDEDDNLDLEAEFFEALVQEEQRGMGGDEAPEDDAVAETPAPTQTEAVTPAEESGDDEDGEDADSAEEGDDAAEAEAAEKEDEDEEIANARAAIEQIKAKILSVQAPILKARLQQSLKSAEKQLESLLAERAAAAEGSEDEDGGDVSEED
ncbi:hypothetical protein MCOR23_010028 [Pyricularia oryzae]|nr:hypothetical protein MCOR23_010028 [Pyricularia oryzae]